MTSPVHEGACLCGAARFRIHGAFRRFVLCHCTRCQRASGSAHASNLFAPDARLEWVTGESNVRRFQVPGARFERAFCSTCGAPLPTVLASGNTVMAPAGAIETPIENAPDMHIFCASRAAWEDALNHAPRFDELP